MSGSKMNNMTRAQLQAAMGALPATKDYVWNGVDEDDRPATEQELAAGLEIARRSRGRPAGSGSKEQVAIRFDRDVLTAFRKAGPGWQTRMNDALREWLKTHSPV